MRGQGNEEARTETRSRILLRIRFVENPEEAKKAMDILRRGRQRALQQLLAKGASATKSSTT